ncbi:MAG: hypothetical protein L6R40_004925 [Gallowayella cf. fulva]|nr:MAG: hypothetical protein L6R40_004925 [Xanthomendoza cf. fulva]
MIHFDHYEDQSCVHQPSVLDPIASNFQLFQHETPKQPPIPSLQSTLDRQFGLEQNAAHYGDGASLASAVDSDPVLRRSGVAPDQIATVTTTTSIPRTPRCALRAIPHHVHRPRAKPRAYSLYGTTRSIRPLLRPLPGPNVLKMPFTKPFSKPLPSPPSSDAPGTLCSRPLSFETLPLEIKHMIYRELLVSKQPIRKPHKLVCNKRSIMLDSVQPVKDIDSSILRVSRTVYQEALPVLYGKNTFEFCKPRKLRDFSHAGLDRSHTQFGFREAPAGRFTLIRSIILRLGHDRKPYIWQRPGGTGAPPAPDRKRIWSHWYQYFFNDCDPRNQFDWGMFPSASNEFPALNRLELDFTDWQLSASDAIRIDPFIKKFGRSGGLRALAIKGMKNGANIAEFQRGLLKSGGSFTVKI